MAVDNRDVRSLQRGRRNLYPDTIRNRQFPRSISFACFYGTEQINILRVSVTLVGSF